MFHMSENSRKPRKLCNPRPARLLLRAEPAVLRQVDGHTVGSTELDLDVASLGHLLCSRVGTMHGTRFLDPCSRLFHVLDFEAEVVDAGPPERALCLGGLVVFELEDSEVHVSIAQVVALGSWSVNFTYLLQAEALDVELRRRLQVSRGDRDVTNSCHCLPPSVSSFRAVGKDRSGLLGLVPPVSLITLIFPELLEKTVLVEFLKQRKIDKTLRCHVSCPRL